jgi:hypothetical protein
MQQKEAWTSTKRASWPRGFHSKRELAMRRLSPQMARYSSIKTVISLAAEMGWGVHQMDVKTAFLNGVVEEEVYVEQSEGFEISDRETHVCRLRRALYELKQGTLGLVLED